MRSHAPHLPSARSLLLAVLAVAATLLGATSAEAAQRYVSPAGTGGAPCSSANPCPLQAAVETVAVAGDEVILAPGTYNEGANTLDSSLSGLLIHGAAGQPKPTIVGTSDAGAQVNVQGTGAVVSDLRISHSTTNTTPALFLGQTAKAERVEVTSTGVGIQIEGDSRVRDSIAIGGTEAYEAGISAYVGGAANHPTIRNVTALGANGIYAGSSSAVATVVLDVRSSIAIGSPGEDVQADNFWATSTTIDLQSSNYDSITPLNPFEHVTAPGTGNNQTAAPQFVDAGAGNYHQAAGSPTIDAGTADSLTGTTDLDGAARSQGAAIDIGAYEFVPPAPPPAADTTPPETTIDKGPKKRSNSKRATFEFSSSEAGSTFSCKVDANPTVACTSPLRLKLKRGKHTVGVVATDASGNADASPATYTWKVKKKRKHHRH